VTSREKKGELCSTKTVPPFPSEHTIATEIAYFMGKKISVTNSTLRTLIDELGTECQNVIALIYQLQLPDLSDRQKAEVLAEFLPLCNRSQRSLLRGFSETNC
jgi:hypothetical protein